MDWVASWEPSLWPGRSRLNPCSTWGSAKNSKLHSTLFYSTFHSISHCFVAFWIERYGNKELPLLPVYKPKDIRSLLLFDTMQYLRIMSYKYRLWVRKVNHSIWSDINTKSKTNSLHTNLLENKEKTNVITWIYIV